MNGVLLRITCVLLLACPAWLSAADISIDLPTAGWIDSPDLSSAGQSNVVVQLQQDAMNHSVILQSGVGSLAFTSQTGDANEVEIDQAGEQNRVLLKQEGQANQADVLQNGVENVTTLQQIGSFNGIEINQFGWKNTLNALQEGGGEMVRVTQENF